jgi:hypothetical protein
MPGANESFVFFRCAAQFGKRELALYSQASANLDERECISLEADQIEFAFAMLRHVVSSNEDIAEAPQAPVSIRFPTHTCRRRLKLLLLGSGSGCVGKTVTRLPLHERKSDSPENLPPSFLPEY